MPNELSVPKSELISQDDIREIVALDDTIRTSQLEIADAARRGNDMLKAMIVARATAAIRRALTPKMMGDVMELMGSPLGFRTDKDREPKKYDVDTVRDCLIVGVLKGARPVGNEINIIAGNCYLTKEAFARILSEWPGLTHLKLDVGVPKMIGDHGALVPCMASWRLNGGEDSITCKGTVDDPSGPVAVRVNKGMGIDAIQGKAKSKLLRRIYERVTGNKAVSVEEVSNTIDGEYTVGQEFIEDTRFDDCETLATISKREHELLEGATFDGQAEDIKAAAERAREQLRSRAKQTA